MKLCCNIIHILYYQYYWFIISKNSSHWKGPQNSSSSNSLPWAGTHHLQFGVYMPYMILICHQIHQSKWKWGTRCNLILCSASQGCIAKRTAKETILRCNLSLSACICFYALNISLILQSGRYHLMHLTSIYLFNALCQVLTLPVLQTW